MFVIKDGTTGGADTPPDIRQQIIAWLNGDNMVVRTKDQDTQVVAQAVTDATAALKIDSIVKDTTGIEKNASESYGDYVKRAVAKKLEEITALQAKVTKYEKDGADGSVLATEYKQRLEIIQGQHDKLKIDSAAELEQMKKTNFETRVDNEIKIAVSKIPVMKMHDDATINAQLQEEVRQSRIAKFKGEMSAVELDGQIAFKGKDGKYIRKSTDASIDTIDNIIIPYFDPIRDKSNTQGGAGSKPPGGGDQPNPPNGGDDKNKKWAGVKIADSVKSQMQLTQWLTTDQKLKMDSTEFAEAFAHFNKDANNQPLPFQPKAA